MRTQREFGRSFLKFDYVRSIVNPYRAELAEEILAQQSVKIHVKHLFELVQVHDGDLLGGPCILAQPDIGRTSQRISGEARTPLAALRAL